MAALHVSLILTLHHACLTEPDYTSPAYQLLLVWRSFWPKVKPKIQTRSRWMERRSAVLQNPFVVWIWIFQSELYNILFKKAMYSYMNNHECFCASDVFMIQRILETESTKSLVTIRTSFNLGLLFFDLTLTSQ